MQQPVLISYTSAHWGLHTCLATALIIGASTPTQAAQQPACRVTLAQLEQLWDGGGGSGDVLPREPYLPAAHAALRQHARWLHSHEGPFCRWLRERE